MSKKIVAFSLLSLSILLCWCWNQNNNADYQCADDTCSNQNAEVTTQRDTNRTTSEIEGDIVGFTENSGDIPVAEKTDWETIVIQWEERSF